MLVWPVVLVGAALLAVASGGRGFRVERAPFRHIWMLFVAAGLQVVPLKSGLRGLSWADGLSRASMISAFGLLAVFFVLNRRSGGAVVMLVGVLLNLAVIVGNGGRMPIEAGAARAAGSGDVYAAMAEAGPQRHAQAGPGTALRILDDRIPVAPFHQVLSVGDLVLGAGLAWWVLTVMGSRLVPHRPQFELGMARR